MNSILNNYLKEIRRKFKDTDSRELSYRSALETLIRDLKLGEPINEGKATSSGRLDLVIKRKEIPVCYIETKDIGQDLDNKLFQEQLSRYKAGLRHLIITNYLEFRFFQGGRPFGETCIGEVKGHEIRSVGADYQEFIDLMHCLLCHAGEPIKSSKQLAESMARVARVLKKNIGMLTGAGKSLHGQYEAIKSTLIDTLKAEEFADMYAQTLTYGMFVARINDKNSKEFDRAAAAKLIPKSNAFLKGLFSLILSDDIGKTTLDELANILRITDVDEVLKDVDSKGLQDPMIHFYETFLSEYDPEKKKEKGVWYTPKPIVRFIVRAIDDLLRSEFGLEGLKDSSKLAEPKESASGAHRVQILDPAAGTGNFLIELIEHIYESHFQHQKGSWSNYVSDHLIPRLHGFELLMTSYAITHLNMDLCLRRTGYHNEKERLRVYLTNSLEGPASKEALSIARWLSTEANEAKRIKEHTPVMIVLGNPPYKGHSANKNEWIKDLLDAYKKEPGGKKKLQEPNPKWINDDYVKFIRLGAHYVSKNKEGVLAFINNHAFLQNPTFRGMRWHLLSTFDKIYVIDLHGNLRMKEVAPDGSADQNVFDIRVGVSINIFVKTGKKKADELAEVYHSDLWGRREDKFDALERSSLQSLPFKR